MTRSLRALGRSHPRSATVCVALAAALCAHAAQEQGSNPGLASAADASSCLKVFDFDERCHGNYEDTPMHWLRLTGDGLPAYSYGRFDESVGHEAPPSFLFTLRGGNIGYEYAHDDLLIPPGADWQIEGYIRTEGLEYASAVILCYLVDETGQRVPRSERISTPVRSIPVAGDGWQPVQLAFTGDSSVARRLRLQLWVIQDYVWKQPAGSDVDPIIRQDVAARVWFDDIRICRTARLHLGFSDPGGLVRPGASASLLVDVHNTTTSEANVGLEIRTADGELRNRADFAARAGAEEHFETSVPPLAPGLYEARATLAEGGQPHLERRLRFAVLPPLPEETPPTAEIGLDLGRWSGGSVQGVRELVHELGCAAVKVHVVASERTTGGGVAQELREVRQLARELALDQVRTTAVLLPPAPSELDVAARSLSAWVQSDPGWGVSAAATFASLGSDIFSWQLGAEQDEVSASAGWTREAVARAREAIDRVVAGSELVVPRSIFDTPAVADLLDDAASPPVSPPDLPSIRPPAAYSFWVPASVPARLLPWHLFAFLNRAESEARDAAMAPRSARGGDVALWLCIDSDTTPETTVADRVADLVRRVVLARAANPDRLYVPAPFECTATAGTPRWAPNEAYIPLRTLLHYVAGRRVVASFTFEPDGVALLFRGANGDTLIVWSWAYMSDGTLADLYVGPDASAVSLDGSPVALEKDDVRARVPVGPTPLILANVDGALLEFRESVRVAPVVVPFDGQGPTPVLWLRNTYPALLAGEVQLTPPSGWEISPNPILLSLAPGASLEQPLRFRLPPRQLASGQHMGIDIRVTAPNPAALHFDVPLEVEWKGITLQPRVAWDGDDLLVEHTLWNHSNRPVSFLAFCQAPRQARRDGQFLNVAPGSAHTLAYRFRQARHLSGEQLWLGVREVGGPRALDQLVPIPR